MHDLHIICYRKTANEVNFHFLNFASAIPAVAIIQTLPVNITTYTVSVLSPHYLLRVKVIMIHLNPNYTIFNFFPTLLI